MAFTITSAAAQETDVTVTKEDTGTCNPCAIEIEGESELVHPVIGPVFSSDDEL